MTVFVINLSRYGYGDIIDSKDILGVNTYQYKLNDKLMQS